MYVNGSRAHIPYLIGKAIDCHLFTVSSNSCNTPTSYFGMEVIYSFLLRKNCSLLYQSDMYNNLSKDASKLRHL